MRFGYHLLNLFQAPEGGRTILSGFLMLFGAVVPLSGQSSLTEVKKADVSGILSVTNDGISTIPAFNLNKPAAIMQMFIGNRLTFEPDMRFSFEAKPWQFIYWLKYKMIDHKTIRWKVGANASYNFFDVPNHEATTDKESTVIQKTPLLIQI